MLGISVELKNRKADLLELLKKADALDQTIKENAEFAETLWEQMGFRERYLWGWFWGDRDLVLRRRDLIRTTDGLQESAETLREKIAGLRNEIDIDIVTELHQSNPGFRVARDHMVATGLLEEAAIRCREALEEAMNDISSAQSMETYDLVSTNNVASILSSSANSEAQYSISEAEEALREFDLALKKYDQTETGLRGMSEGIDDFPDLILDLVLDLPFDFMSWSTLSQLSNCEDELEEIWRSLQPFWSRVTETAHKARQEYGRFIQEAFNSIP
ncbi:MAG TPA: hypothetical protein VLA04_06270 [Verrucomicrobiae bacterium]|nr:hypothetical protein [Verrucomicrobiae bacterium]